MKYRKLGRTGLKVSVIGLGTWQFGGEWGKEFAQDEVTAMLGRARDLGINLIDTAECYGDHVSERLIGQAIKDLGGERSEWVIATKFGHKYQGFLNRTEPRSPKDVRRQLEDSLKALQTDYVDLYQYHSWGDGQFFNNDVHAELERMMEEGKVHHLGNSVSKNDNVKQIQASTKRYVQSIQIIYNRLDRVPENTTFPVCIKQGLGVLARVPLASGYLSGKYKPGDRFPEGDVRARRDQKQLDDKLREVQRIAEKELPEGVPLPQYALAWCLKHPAVSAVIPGCKDLAQVESNAAAADLEMVSDSHPQKWTDPPPEPPKPPRAMKK
jgi:aryl-alcohol dehydrogenase-like predicted oxidoreductase